MTGVQPSPTPIRGAWTPIRGAVRVCAADRGARRKMRRVQKRGAPQNEAPMTGVQPSPTPIRGAWTPIRGAVRVYRIDGVQSHDPSVQRESDINPKSLFGNDLETNRE